MTQDNVSDIIPPSPTVPKKVRKSADPAVDVLFPGSEVVWKPGTKGAAVENLRWFWCGILPEIGRINSVTIAGILFPRTHELVRSRPGGESQRIPYIGGLSPITRPQLQLLGEKLLMSVFRFTEPPGEFPAAGAGLEALEDENGNQLGRQGHPVRVLTEQELEMRRKNDGAARPYNPRPWDEPLSKFVFCVPVTDQSNPTVGMIYPSPVSETGLVWPR